MTLDEILKNWKEESDAANELVIDILESYMEFVDVVKRTTIIYPLLKLCDQRKKDWTPLLETAKKTKKLAREAES